MHTPQPRARSRAARTLTSGAALALLFVVATGQASTGGCDLPEVAPAPAPSPDAQSAPAGPGPQGGGGAQPARPARPGSFPEIRREPGVVQGMVVDAQGRPIAGAEVAINGQLNAGPRGRGSVSTTTDAQGRYRVQLGQGIVEVNASTRLIFDGQRYTVALHPADDRKGHEDVHNGIVKNFYLKVSGPRPGVEPIRPDRQYRRYEMAGQHYGGYMQVDLITAPRGLNAFDEGDVIELRLTPVAPLLDGTQGQVLTFRRQITATTRSGWYQFDIPLGRYRVEAFASVGGGPMRPMRVTHDVHLQAPAASMIADVLPHGSENDGARASTMTADFRVEVHR